MSRKSVSAFLILLVLPGMIFFNGCKKSRDVNGSAANQLDISIRIKTFQVLDYCVPTMANLLYQYLTRTYNSIRNQEPIEFGEYEDGWWRFENISLIDDQKADGRLQLLDDNDIPHKDYNENTTARIMPSLAFTKCSPIAQCGRAAIKLGRVSRPVQTAS